MALFNYIDLSATEGTPATYTFTTDQNVLIGGYAANTSSESITVSIQLRGKYLAKNVEIPYGSSLPFLVGKVVIRDTDQITLTVQSPVGGTMDVNLSVLEDAIPAA
jgi:hypothetical protein